MANKKMLWQGDDLIEKIENVIEKIAGILLVALLIYAYVLS